MDGDVITINALKALVGTLNIDITHLNKTLIFMNSCLSPRRVRRMIKKCDRNLRANQRCQGSPMSKKADASLGTSLELEEHMKKFRGYGINQAMTGP